MNNFAVLQALAFEPRQAFAELDARPRYWWPLLVVTLCSAAVSIWYVAIVDLEWLADHQLRMNPLTQGMTEEEIQRRARQASGSRGVQVVITGLGSVLVGALLMLLMALYYSLAGKITAVERGFRHWLALSAWTSTSSLLALIPAAIVLLTASSNQIPQDAMQVLSFNTLFAHREAGEPGFTLFTTMNLAQLIGLYLAACGVKVWSGRSWTFSIIFTALPFALVFGIWAFFSLRST